MTSDDAIRDLLRRAYGREGAPMDPVTDAGDACPCFAPDMGGRHDGWHVIDTATGDVLGWVVRQCTDGPWRAYVPLPLNPMRGRQVGPAFAQRREAVDEVRINREVGSQ